MTPFDPRLRDPSLLRLAALRVVHQQQLPPDLPPAPEGLATLLDYARRHPPPAARDLTSPHTGLARLLEEARDFLGREPSP